MKKKLFYNPWKESFSCFKPMKEFDILDWIMFVIIIVSSIIGRQVIAEVIAKKILTMAIDNQESEKEVELEEKEMDEKFGEGFIWFGNEDS